MTVPPGQGVRQHVVVLNEKQESLPMYLDYKPPVITAVAKLASVTDTIRGATLGGTIVDITGLDLGTGTDCRALFTTAGGVALPSPTVLNWTHTQVKLELPAGAGGAGLRITLDVNTQLSAALDFTYYLPEVQSVSPSSGPTNGLVNVSIAGKDFGNGSPIVTVGGFNCTIIATSQSSINCTLPPGEGSSARIVVTAEGQTNTEANALAFAFAYDPPTVLSISRTHCATSGVLDNGASRCEATIKGRNFGLNTVPQIVFQGTATSPWTGDRANATVLPENIINRTHEEISFYIPPGQGPNKIVRVIVSGQESGQTNVVFSYDAPMITSVLRPGDCTDKIKRDSSCGSPTTGAFLFSFAGTSLGTKDAVVTIGNTKCTSVRFSQGGDCAITSQSDGKVTVSAPAMIVSWWDNQLVSNVGVPISLQVGSQRMSNASLVYKYDAPWINDIVPRAGDAMGGSVRIEGINFGPNPGTNYERADLRPQIYIGGKACTTPTWEVDSQGPYLTCDLPSMTVGTKDINFTVAAQSVTYSRDEWNSQAGKKLFYTKCGRNFYGVDGEECIKCPHKVDSKGKEILGETGQLQYIADCPGGSPGFPVPKEVVPELCNASAYEDPERKVSCQPYALPGFWKYFADTGKVNGSVRSPNAEVYCDAARVVTRAKCTYLTVCEPFEACTGNNTCKSFTRENGEVIPQYVGERCSDCASPYFFRRDGLCEECPTNPWMIVAVFSFGILCVLVGTYVLAVYDLNFAILSIGIDYFQVLSIFSGVRINWPGSMRTIFNWLSAFNFNIDLAAPECALTSINFKEKWFMIMGLPLSCIVIFLIAYIGMTCHRCMKSAVLTTYIAYHHLDMLIGYSFVMMYYLYLSLLKSVLDIFNCSPTDPVEVDKDGNIITYMQVQFERCYAYNEDGTPGLHMQ